MTSDLVLLIHERYFIDRNGKPGSPIVVSHKPWGQLKFVYKDTIIEQFTVTISKALCTNKWIDIYHFELGVERHLYLRRFL